MSYYIGIDFGGTNISGGIVDISGKVLLKKSTPTKAERNYNEIILDMINLCKGLCCEYGLEIHDIEKIGIGCPGSIDSESGNIEYVNNLNFNNVNMKNEFARFFDTPVYIDNDANCAALGESISGACKNVKNSITITLGTGIGGGIIIDGKIYNGSFSCGGEVGHIVIEHNGRPCSCGRKGCFEAYCATSALTKYAKKVISNHPEADIYKAVLGNVDVINTELLFEFYKNNEVLSKKIIEEYISYLADGITNLVNIFQPDIIAIGGGISAQGDTLLKPVIDIVKKDVYGGVLKTKIVKAILGNDAGIVGAAMLGN